MPGLVDLTVNQEDRNPRVFGFLHGGDRGIRAGVVHDDRLRALRNRQVEVLILQRRVVIVDQHQRLITERLRCRVRRIRFRLEERVVVRRRDDHDQAFAHDRFLLDGRELEVIVDVVRGDEDAVNREFLFGGQFAGRDVGVRLFDGQRAELSDRLQHGRGDLTFLDGVHHVLRAVKADHDHIGHAGGLQGGHRAHRHRVVAGDDTLDVRMRLDDGFHHVERFGLRPVGGLLRDEFQVGIFADHVVVALRADVRVGVGVLARQFDVLTLFAHQPHEFFRARDRTLVVVGDDLRGGDTRRVDLTVNQEDRNPRVFGFLHGRDRGIRAGVVHDDRFRALRNRQVEVLVLQRRVVVVNQHQRLITECLRCRVRRIRFRLEERVVVRRRDDHDQAAFLGDDGRQREPCPPAPSPVR